MDKKELEFKLNAKRIECNNHLQYILKIGERIKELEANQIDAKCQDCEYDDNCALQDQFGLEKDSYCSIAKPK